LAHANFHKNAAGTLLRVVFFEAAMATFDKNETGQWEAKSLNVAVTGHPLISDLHTPESVPATAEYEALELQAVALFREILPDIQEIFK